MEDRGCKIEEGEDGGARIEDGRLNGQGRGASSPPAPLLRGGGEGVCTSARVSPGWRHARVHGGGVGGFLESDCEGERVELEATSVSDPGLVSDTPSGF